MESKNNSTKIVFLVCAVFAIVIVTIGASFALFTYSRTGNVVNKIQMGNIEFAMLDGSEATLTNAFPQEDKDGINNAGYTFNVRNTSTQIPVYYNVSLVKNNNDASKHYFADNQIKFALTKSIDGATAAYVAETGPATGSDGTVTSAGRLVSSVITSGDNGVVLSNQQIDAGKTDAYELILWIDNGVNYSGTIDENGLMNGKYNDYEYSLRVKVSAQDSEISS